VASGRRPVSGLGTACGGPERFVQLPFKLGQDGRPGYGQKCPELPGKNAHPVSLPAPGEDTLRGPLDAGRALALGEPRKSSRQNGVFSAGNGSRALPALTHVPAGGGPGQPAPDARRSARPAGSAALGLGADVRLDDRVHGTEQEGVAGVVWMLAIPRVELRGEPE